MLRLLSDDKEILSIYFCQLSLLKTENKMSAFWDMYEILWHVYFIFEGEASLQNSTPTCNHLFCVCLPLKSCEENAIMNKYTKKETSVLILKITTSRKKRSTPLNFA